MTAAESTIRARLEDLRLGVLNDLVTAAEGILLTPAAQPSERVLAALSTTLKAYDELVTATSRSNPGFAHRDLMPDEQAKYERAKHAVGVLTELHGPKVAEG